jgi:hypothetical protein
MCRLIVYADAFGLSERVDEGILYAHRIPAMVIGGITGRMSWASPSTLRSPVGSNRRGFSSSPNPRLHTCDLAAALEQR